MQKFKKLAKTGDWPTGSERRANLGGPDFNCSRIKLISLQLLLSKTEKIEFRGGKEITSKINELQLIGKTYFLYYNRRFNIVIFIYQNIEEKPSNFSFEFFLR